MNAEQEGTAPPEAATDGTRPGDSTNPATIDRSSRRAVAGNAVRSVTGSWRRSGSGRLGLIGAGLLVGFTLVALLAPVLAPYDPDAQTGGPFAGPSTAHLLGTNDVGQDILSELIVGTRISMTVGVLSAIIAVLVGGGVGLVAGLFRGWSDSVLMRLVDITLALPFLPLLIVLSVFLGRSLITTTLVIAAVIWAQPARVIRSQTLSIRERAHVEVARAMGAGPLQLLSQHIAPGVSPLLIAQFVRAANVAILLQASLAFLSLGDPTNKSWGTMLYYANSRGAFLTDAWLWWVVPTGLAISLVVVAFAFVGYALEEWADPRLRTRSVPSLAQLGLGASLSAPKEARR